MDHSKRASRREFLKNAALLTVAAPCLGYLGQVLTPSAFAKAEKAKEVPLPEGQVAVPESDPVATAIGYKIHVKDIDFTRYPDRKKAAAKNNFCNNCALFSKVNDGWGKCQMLTTGLVSSEGWCGSWSKKS